MATAIMPDIIEESENNREHDMAESLGQRIRKAREDAGYRTQGALANLMGISRSAVSQWETGATIPTHENLKEISGICNVPLDWLATGRAHRRKMTASSLTIGYVAPWDEETPLADDEVELPLFREVELAAGSGRTYVQENRGAKLRFAKSTLSRKGIDPSQAACCYVSGDSMAPILPDGSTVAVNTDERQVVDGKLYAIDHGGLLRVKYLYRLPGGGIRIRSVDRDQYPDEDLSPDDLVDLRVIGRVFWYAVLL